VSKAKLTLDVHIQQVHIHR